MRGAARNWTLLVQATLLLATLLGASGCGQAAPPRMAVSGRVTLDGRPLAEGTISFMPAGEVRGPKAGDVIRQGVYNIPKDSGPLIGLAKVVIRSNNSKPIDPKLHDSMSRAPPRELVPAHYNDNSILTAEVTDSGVSEFNFILVTNLGPKP